MENMYLWVFFSLKMPTSSCFALDFWFIWAISINKCTIHSCKAEVGARNGYIASTKLRCFNLLTRINFPLELYLLFYEQFSVERILIQHLYWIDWSAAPSCKDQEIIHFSLSCTFSQSQSSNFFHFFKNDWRCQLWNVHEVIFNMVPLPNI